MAGAAWAFPSLRHPAPTSRMSQPKTNASTADFGLIPLPGKFLWPQKETSTLPILSRFSLSRYSIFSLFAAIFDSGQAWAVAAMMCPPRSAATGNTNGVPYFARLIPQDCYLAGYAAREVRLTQVHCGYDNQQKGLPP